MTNFKIASDFLIDDKKIKIISGAIHYFRIVPEYWEHSLFNLKALGCNTVETYIPWNFHESKEGIFEFHGRKNVANFIELAAKQGLYVILRPSPFICAEWEFGGLPAWLLNYNNLRLRAYDSLFLEKVRNYFENLLPRLLPYQITNDGPVIMMQIENEYGSFANDKLYLKALKNMMLELGVDVPLFTSDGSWRQTLKAGSILDDDILITGNFGSKGDLNFKALESFMQEYNKTQPLMCMEFWDGWFNRYGESIIRRDAIELADEAKKVLERGSINFYMFHGGTNFGFMNGCSARGNMDLPQVTSYDYDAILTEWGDPTKKFFALQDVIKNIVPGSWQTTPKTLKKKDYGKITLSRKVALFNTLSEISKPIYSIYPLTMEMLNQQYGYILYRTSLEKELENITAKLINAGDRVHIYNQQKHVVTQYREEVSQEFTLELPNNINEIDILIENMGRVNYGAKLQAESQKKGIRTGLMIDIHFHTNWEIYSLPLDNPKKIDFDKGWEKDVPAFYEYEFYIEECADTFLNTSVFGKGCAFINNFNLGRFWNKGPIGYLYIPSPLLKKGKNIIVIFETEGIYSEEILLQDKPTYIDVIEDINITKKSWNG